MVRSVISLIRPAQWIKNLFVFLPLFFGGKMASPAGWSEAFIGFFAFSFIASAVYCLNDLKDIEEDRLHPEKRNRPLASGAVPPSLAVGAMAVLIILSCGLCFLLPSGTDLKTLGVIFVYFLLNLGYSLVLKQYAILDVFIVAFGFVLRLFAGGFACDIPLSPWIVLMTFLLALFLAFAKRRDDVLIMKSAGVAVRRNVGRYNLEFLNQTLCILGAVTIVCYLMYCLSGDVTERLGTEYLYLTSVFVIAGILRYLQLTLVDGHSGNPTAIALRDRFIQGAVSGWLVSFFFLLYI